MSSPKSLRAIFSEDEIVVNDIWTVFWSKRKYLFISIIVFAIIGFITATTTPKEYSANCVLLGEEGGGGSGNAGMQALAGLAGISSGASSGGGVSELYPIILTNMTFLVELSKDTVHLDDNSATTMREYFKKPLKQDAITIAKTFISEIPSNIKGWFSSAPKQAPVAKTAHPEVIREPQPHGSQTTMKEVASDAIRPLSDSQNLEVIKLSGEDLSISAILGPRIKLNQNGREVSLSVRMPEARLSAEAANLVLNKMVQYVIKYKTNKQLQNLNFLEARAAEASEAYKRNQQKVAGFNDQNYGVVYQSVKAKESQLQNEFSITLGTYNLLANQLEQAKIDLKKQTPLFTVLEPVYIPSSPTPVNTGKVVFTHVAIGTVVGLVLIFFLLVVSYIFDGKKIKKQRVTEVV